MTKAKAHLSDLYRRGASLTLDDGDVGEVEVYLKKLNPIEAKEAREKGNAARARVLMKRKDKDSDIWLDAYTRVIDMEEEERVSLIVAPEVLKRRIEVEVEVAHEDEWLENDYLDGIHEAWQDGLDVQYQSAREKVDDGVEEEELEKGEKEALKAMEEMTRFSDQVDKIMKSETSAIERPIKSYEEEQLIEKAVESLFEKESYDAWVDAFLAARIYFATRDVNDHAKKHFRTFRDAQEVEPEVLTALLEGYRKVELVDLEVKGSEQSPTS